MKLLLLISLLAGEPALWEGQPALRSPATVTKVAPALATDFAGAGALTNITLPTRGAEIVMLGDNPALQLISDSRDGVTFWIQLPPEAARRHVQISGRARSMAEPSGLEVGSVQGTRSVAAAPGWARWTIAAPVDWASFEMVTRLPLGADSLAVRLPGKDSQVCLDDLKIAIQTRIRDEEIAHRAEWSGNLLTNGGFEAGETGFQVITTHPTIMRSEPPLPALLRVTGSEPNEGTKCAQMFVVDGPTTLTPEPVVLQPGRKYTFSFDARARTTAVARLGMRMERADGLEAAEKEVALSGAWRRIKSTFETDQLGPAIWQPRIEGFPIESPYALELDGLCLVEGEGGDYRAPDRAVLSLDDGLSEPFGMGQVIGPTETLTMKARLTAGAEAFRGEIHAELLSALGTARMELPLKKVEAAPGATVEAELFKGTLPPGWYRFRAWLQAGDYRYDEATRQVACLVPPPADDGWRMAVRWTTPDGLFRGRARRTMLSRLTVYGLDTRWLGPNAVALWQTLEPQPGHIETAALAAMIEDGAAAKLGTVVELNAFPRVETAPDWLLARASRVGTRLAPAAETWQRHVEGVVAGVKAEQVRWALAEPPADTALDNGPARQTLREVLAALAPKAALVLPGQYAELPEVLVGPLDPTYLEVRESVSETDPFAAEARRIQALLGAAAAGSRQMLWPNQGLFPAANGAHRTPGMTDAAGGPRPIVAAWSTLRQVIGAARPTADVSGGGVRAVGFGDGPAVVALWSEGTPVVMTIGLASVPAASLATGESVKLRSSDEGVTLTVGAWPIYVTGLDAAAAGAILGAVTARQ